jgi:hypothetical protein
LIAVVLGTAVRVDVMQNVAGLLQEAEDEAQEEVTAGRCCCKWKEIWSGKVTDESTKPVPSGSNDTQLWGNSGDKSWMLLRYGNSKWTVQTGRKRGFEVHLQQDKGKTANELYQPYKAKVNEIKSMYPEFFDSEHYMVFGQNDEEWSSYWQNAGMAGEPQGGFITVAGNTPMTLSQFQAYQPQDDPTFVTSEVPVAPENGWTAALTTNRDRIRSKTDDNEMLVYVANCKAEMCMNSWNVGTPEQLEYTKRAPESFCAQDEQSMKPDELRRHAKKLLQPGVASTLHFFSLNRVLQ